MGPSNEAHICDQWRSGKSQIGHFHVVSLQNGLRFLLSEFVLELLHDYGIAPSQLAPNIQELCMFDDLIDGSHSDLDVIGIGSHVCSRRELYLVTHDGLNNGINIMPSWLMLIIK